MEEAKKVPKTMARSPGHYEEWLLACKGGPRPVSNFDYAGPLTEIVLLGVLALRAPGGGSNGTARTSRSRMPRSSINTSTSNTAKDGRYKCCQSLASFGRSGFRRILKSASPAKSADRRVFSLKQCVGIVAFQCGRRAGVGRWNWLAERAAKSGSYLFFSIATSFLPSRRDRNGSTGADRILPSSEFQIVYLQHRRRGTIGRLLSQERCKKKDREERGSRAERPL